MNTDLKSSASAYQPPATAATSGTAALATQDPATVLTSQLRELVTELRKTPPERERSKSIVPILVSAAGVLVTLTGVLVTLSFNSFQTSMKKREFEQHRREFRMGMAERYVPYITSDSSRALGVKLVGLVDKEFADTLGLLFPGERVDDAWRQLHSGGTSTTDVRESYWKQEPTITAGESHAGRLALINAIAELRAGAKEEGGNNKGLWVIKYTTSPEHPRGEEVAWATYFVNWCFRAGKAEGPFPLTPNGLDLRERLTKYGWFHPSRSRYTPAPGDILIWNFRNGHSGIVHSVRDGLVYTIEGNVVGNDGVEGVHGRQYVLSQIDSLVGYAHVVP